MADNDVNIRLFLYRLNAGFMDIAYIYGKVHAIGGYLPMKWVEYDHEEIPFSMDKYSIHGSAISMGTMQHISPRAYSYLRQSKPPHQLTVLHIRTL